MEKDRHGNRIRPCGVQGKTLMVAVETERMKWVLNGASEQNLLMDKFGDMRSRPHHTIPGGTTYMTQCNVVPLNIMRNHREISFRFLGLCD